ncbi:conserved hypothetical protein [Ricinus communis]|uniref:Uncharacterized protein n=1 Tax=Ricinus communis TaxID=3988 RepID=B9T1A9_RICCO|nr:conserved hypothetical protein [Ricinus communis]
MRGLSFSEARVSVGSSWAWKSLMRGRTVLEKGLRWQISYASARILVSSLKNRILPTINYLRGILETDEKVIYALNRCLRTLKYDTDAMVSNVGILRAHGHGVLEPDIRSLTVWEPLSLMLRVDLFEQVVQEVKRMGFEPINKSKSFIYALQSMAVISRSHWERKREFLMSFGWSESEFLLAFRLQPFFMLTSEKKMKVLMEFFLTKLCLQPSDIVKCPNHFLVNLERRVIPRCSALKLLMSKGSIDNSVPIMLLTPRLKNLRDKAHRETNTAPDPVCRFDKNNAILCLYY